MYYVRYSVELSKLNNLATFNVTIELKHMYLLSCPSSHSASLVRYKEYLRAGVVFFISKPFGLRCIQSPRSGSTKILKKMCFTCPKTNPLWFPAGFGWKY